jgi:hypothetical protein
VIKKAWSHVNFHQLNDHGYNDYGYNDYGFNDHGYNCWLQTLFIALKYVLVCGRTLLQCSLKVVDEIDP